MGNLSEARTLIGQINLDKDPSLGNLKYAGKLKTRQVPTDEVTWVDRAEDFGLAPITAPGQNSPIVPQGTYKQFKSAGIQIKFVKRFTDHELSNILSPDSRYKVDGLYHLRLETEDMMRRMRHTQEYIINSAITRGAVKFVNNDPSSQMNLNLTFPTLTKTPAILWSDAVNGVPVTNINAWLDTYELANGKRPEKMRMSQKVWNAIKANAEFKGQFTSYLRTTGMNVGDVPAGLLTPEMAAKALGWPLIELYTETYQVKFTAKNTETAGANVTIELVGENGYQSTFGLNVGDKILIGYDGEGSWTEETTVETVTEGASIVADIANNITAGTVIVAKPSFHPVNRITFLSDENLIEEVQTPFGLETSGTDIRPAAFYGMRADIFTNSEPNLVAYRRLWAAGGYKFNPKRFLNAAVL